MFDQFEDCDQFYNKVYNPITQEYIDINCSMSMDELQEFEDYL